MRSFLVVITIVIVAGIVAVLYLNRANPIIYSFAEKGDPIGEPLWSLFNPFRNKAPEHKAEVFLKILSEGDTERAINVGIFSDTAKCVIRSRKEELQIKGWRLINRKDHNEEVCLSYYCSGPCIKSDLDYPIWVTLKRSGSAWVVVNFQIL